MSYDWQILPVLVEGHGSRRGGGYDQLLVDGGSTCVGSDDRSISLPDALQVDKL